MIKQSIIKKLIQIVEEGNVLVDKAGLMAYSYDSALDRGKPDVVVLPTSTEEVSRILALCHKEKIPFIARGSGTNLCGGTIAARGGLILELSNMKRILEINPQEGYAVVEPGVINFQLQKALDPLGYFFAPDPASYKVSTIGGNVANNSGGPHCVKYGVTSHHVLGLEVVLPDGEVRNFHVDQPGPDWVGLFVGSEGTLGVATKMTLKILPKPEAVRTMLAIFPAMEDCLACVIKIVSEGILPSTLEVMDRITIEAVEAFLHAGYPQNAEAVLLAEVDGKVQDLDQDCQRIRRACESCGCLEFRYAETEPERLKLWEGRRGSYPALARLAPNVLVEDGAVPRSRLIEAFKKIRQIGRDEGINVSQIFHAGDGNLHPQIIFDERDPGMTKKVKQAGMKMLQVCIQEGGTISGEHGIGTDKLEAMKWLFSKPTLELFHRIKKAIDSQGIANPGKLIPDIERRMQNAERRTNDKNAKTGESSAVLDYDVPNFTITVGAEMETAELVRIIAKNKQYLPLGQHGTIGAAIATKQYPLRDHILGMCVTLANGEIVSFGAKVMKNVAGYDAAKLLYGSWGQLGRITQVTLRLWPQPFVVQEREPVRKPCAHQDLMEKIKRAFHAAE